MDCPKCGTWNPDDKQVCWRCQATWPKPVEKKIKKPRIFLGLPVWAWVMLVLMLAFFFVTQFGGAALLPH
jgi:hypothetical protein